LQRWKLCDINSDIWLSDRSTMNNDSLFRRRAVRALVFIVVTAVASFAGVIGTFDRSFPVNGNVDLEVLTRSGDITVRNGAAGRFRFMPRFSRTIHGSGATTSGSRGIAEESADSPDWQQHSRRLREYQQYFGRLRNHRPGEHSAAFPYRQRRSDHRGLKGNIDLESGSGDLKLARLAGEMHFQTGSGNVRGTSLRVRQRSRRAAAISILKKQGRARWISAPGPATSR